MQIVIALFAMARVTASTSPAYLPRSIYAAVLRQLRIVESAVRRLIFIIYKTAPAKKWGAPNSHSTTLPDFAKFQNGISSGTPAFSLYDPRKSFHFDDAPTQQHINVKNEVQPTLRGKAITRRLRALKGALNDLPKQAKRMARAEARRAKLPAGPKSVPPLRPGAPPGYRQRASQESDAILQELHYLSLDLHGASP